MKIKNWNKQDMPISKLLTKGQKSLSDTEILSMVLSHGQAGQNALETAQKLLRYIPIQDLDRANIHEMAKVYGISGTVAARIVCSIELAKRIDLAKIQTERAKVTCSRDIAEIMYYMANPNVEEFFVFLLNKANRIICWHKIGIGGISGTVADIRIILKHAIEAYATAIILAHNHPSANIEPSQPDITLTKKITTAAAAMDILVLDHVIVCTQKDRYFSFADENMITQT